MIYSTSTLFTYQNLLHISNPALSSNMKITQALLFAVMAYQANAGLFGGDKITTEQTTDNNLNQQGGDSGDATGNQGDQQAGDGPISVGTSREGALLRIFPRSQLPAKTLEYIDVLDPIVAPG